MAGEVVVGEIVGGVVVVVGSGAGEATVVLHPADTKATSTTITRRRRRVTVASYRTRGCTVPVLMRVVRFTDEYELAAPLYGLSPADLRGRDVRHRSPLLRWLAVRDGAATAVATASVRPDDRTFLQVVGDPEDVAALGPWASHELGRSVHLTVDESAAELNRRLRAAGFVPEVISEGFRIRFADALHRLRRAWIPRPYHVLSSRVVDEDRLFQLDNSLRNDVPGTDGWRGDRDSFHAELAEVPPFDPEAYLVAIDSATDEYAGLVRIWRNDDGPRLGLLGVLRGHRKAPLAAALLRRGLEAASRWGYPTFVTETSLSNAIVHPRLQRLATESTGRFIQMKLEHRHELGRS